jgi:hypothetical protein
MFPVQYRSTYKPRQTSMCVLEISWASRYGVCAGLCHIIGYIGQTGWAGHSVWRSVDDD